MDSPLAMAMACTLAILITAVQVVILSMQFAGLQRLHPTRQHWIPQHAATLR
jgi:hypothetical protein